MIVYELQVKTLRSFGVNRRTPRQNARLSRIYTCEVCLLEPRRSGEIGVARQSLADTHDSVRHLGLQTPLPPWQTVLSSILLCVIAPF